MSKKEIAIESMSTIRFRAKLFSPGGTANIGSWTLLRLPKSASEKLPTRGMTMVEGIINSFPFRAALEPDGKNSHQLNVSKAIRHAAGAEDHGTVSVEITRVGEEPETRVPIELTKALKATPRTQEAWVDITPMARREWVLWITTAKKLETRGQRIEKACDMLASGKRRVCCFPGIKWLTKDLATTEETWLPRQL